MRILTYIARALTGCQHPSTYRERRLLHGAPVMHFVCEACGHAVPAIDRTAGEHHQALQEGAVRLPRAHAKTSTVVEIVRPHRRSA